MLRIFLALSFCLLLCESFSQTKFTYQDYNLPTKASIRGLSVVNDSVAWVSGSSGTVLKTTDAGKTWTTVNVTGFEKNDFRSIYAFDHLRALIASIASPARVLYTEDGGSSWKLVYENTHADAFLDGIDFWDEKRGVIFGDPIGGRMLLARTKDGGKTWEEFKSDQRPVLVEGEASFAASGTGIRCYERNKLAICSGGIKSRLFLSRNGGKKFKSIDLPVIQGKPSTGAFSVAFCKKRAIIAGGDYKIESLTDGHLVISNDGGKKWTSPQTPTLGYRECVEFLSGSLVIATGPSGTDYSNDGGYTWKILNEDRNFHVIRKARKGSLIVMAGVGQLRVLSPLPNY